LFNQNENAPQQKPPTLFLSWISHLQHGEDSADFVWKEKSLLIRLIAYHEHQLVGRRSSLFPVTNKH
jgi:hypothetical protein